MGSDIKWLEGNRIQVAPPKNPLKLTGTRLAAVLGLNKWSTPFKVWCEVTRTYKEPFVDTIYTRAGKIIEPKQAEYMKRCYAMPNIVTPEDVYGKDHFKITHGYFFGDNILNGAWDYLLVDEHDIPTTVLEMKTTKRVEDWQSDIPEYYAIQAALYAYLLGVDYVVMVATVLEDADYEHPEDFVPTVHNTFVRPFKVSERYPDFRQILDSALKWWDDHVVSGISPAYDEKADADILKELRTNSLSPETDIAALVNEGARLMSEIEAAEQSVAEANKRLKVIKDIVKKHLEGQFRDGDKKVSLNSDGYVWQTSKTVSTGFDEEAMKRDGVYDLYHNMKKETVKLTVSRNKEEQ